MLHIDGIHVITKHNWIVATVTLCFPLLNSNVLRTHWLTSKPSEHMIAHLRAIFREFSVLDSIYAVCKINRLLVAMNESNLKKYKRRK